MEKSIHSDQYGTFLRLLRLTRESHGITQTGLAEALGVTQVFVSKCERGERRLDVIELRQWCSALGVRLDEFVRQLDEACGADSVRRRP